MHYNPYIVVPLATWAIAQVAKFALAAMRGQIDFRYLYASGGMPSVHSAVVSSLAVTAALVDGVDSHLFGFTAIFAVVVMYDSFGVRRSTGEQAMVLNLLLDNLDRNRFKLDVVPPRLREILGHQPREVVAGALTGIVLGGVFNYDHLGAFGRFLQAVPVRVEFWVYVGVFAVMVVAGILQRWLLRRRYSKSKVMKHFTSRVFVATQTIGWIGLVTMVFVYERASYMSWRLWPVAVLAAGLFWGLMILTGSAKDLPQGLVAEATVARKQRWLQFGRKSR